MANSSILGGERAASIPAGKDVSALGPSDNSDSGSDSARLAPEGSDTDASGTGERASVEPIGQIDAPLKVDSAVEARDLAVEQARSNDA